MRKPIAIAALSLLMLCCEKKEPEFTGFGDLKLGADFASVKDFDKFESTTFDGEYYMADYEFGNGIGPVSGLYVITFDGKISEVSFRSEDGTNLDAMKKSYSSLQQIELPANQLHRDKIEVYTNRDSTLIMGITNEEIGTNRKILRQKFSYSDQRAIEAKTRRTLKSIGISQMPKPEKK